MPPKDEMSEDQRQDSSDEDTPHFDVIDLDSVDFQPFMTNQSGTAINYHTSDHPEHKLLMRESFMNSEQDETSFQSSSYESIGSQAFHRGISCLAVTGRRLSSHRSNEKEESFPRRHIAFMGVVACTGFIALCHITNVTRFLNKGTFVQATMEKNHSTRIKTIPTIIQESYRDVSDRSRSSSDTHVYWHVPGGQALDKAIYKCFGLDSTSDNGISRKPDNNTVLISRDLWKTASRLNATHQGRLFSLFDDPIDRLLSRYKSSQQERKERGEDPLTLTQYVSMVPDNEMVRGLTDTKEGQLSVEHLNTAKTIVKTKFVVGLLKDPTMSLQKFETFFGWNPHPLKECAIELHPQNPKTIGAVGLPEYQVLAKASSFDQELYRFITLTFREQTV